MTSHATATEDLLRDLLDSPRQRALKAEQQRRQTDREQARLQALLQPTLNVPPAVFLLERAFLTCPACGEPIQATAIRENIIICPFCSTKWGLQAWLAPRRQGIRSGMPQCIAELKAGSTKGQSDLLEGEAKLKNPYFAVDRAVYQCPACSHSIAVGRIWRNSLKCAKCRRHWQVVFRAESLPRAPQAVTS